MAGDWIKIHRKLTEWEWYKDSNTKCLFIHLLLKANWKDGRFQGKDVLRGQLITGRKVLSCDTGMSERTIRTCLERLRDSGEISIKATSKYSIITICNYASFQSDDRGNDQPLDQQTTNKRPTNDQQTTTIEEVNKEKKEKKDNIPYGEIVSFLNEKTGKSYKATTEKTRSFIRARFNDGFNLEDFKKVISQKVGTWSNDPSMCQYLRPETLFGNKFEGYLNEGGIANTSPETKCVDCYYSKTGTCKELNKKDCPSWTKD